MQRPRRLRAVKSATCSVPARLVGYRVKVRLYDERIEGWLGEHRVFEAPRLRATRSERHPRHIDFRHLLPALKRKPGALVRWRLRDALFPRSEYALMWQRLIERLPERRAARTMIALLELAAGDGCEVQLAHELAALLERDELPDLDQLAGRLQPRLPRPPEVELHLPPLADYDRLMVAA